MSVLLWTSGVMSAVLKIFQCLGNYWGQVGVLFHARSLTANINTWRFLVGTRRVPTKSASITCGRLIQV